MSQTTDWYELMYMVVNSNGPNKVPGYKVNIAYSWFFIVFIVFGAFFMTNLFVGVIISAFNSESQRLGKHFLLTEKQKKWMQTKVIVLNMKPELRLIRP